MKVNIDLDVGEFFREGPYEYVRADMVIMVEEDFPVSELSGRPCTDLRMMNQKLRKKLALVFAEPLKESIDDEN